MMFDDLFANASTWTQDVQELSIAIIEFSYLVCQLMLGKFLWIKSSLLFVRTKMIKKGYCPQYLPWIKNNSNQKFTEPLKVCPVVPESRFTGNQVLV